MVLIDPSLRQWESAQDLALSLAESWHGDRLNEIEANDIGDPLDDPGLSIVLARCEPASATLWNTAWFETVAPSPPLVSTSPGDDARHREGRAPRPPTNAPERQAWLQTYRF